MEVEIERDHQLCRCTHTSRRLQRCIELSEASRRMEVGHRKPSSWRPGDALPRPLYDGAVVEPALDKDRSCAVPGETANRFEREQGLNAVQLVKRGRSGTFGAMLTRSRTRLYSSGGRYLLRGISRFGHDSKYRQEPTRRAFLFVKRTGQNRVPNGAAVIGRKRSTTIGLRSACHPLSPYFHDHKRQSSPRPRPGTTTISAPGRA